MHRLLQSGDWEPPLPFSSSCNYFKFCQLTLLNLIWWDRYHRDDKDDVEDQRHSLSSSSEDGEDEDEEEDDDDCDDDSII